MSISELQAVIPPPSNPRNTGTPEKWALAEATLGTTLPKDYKEFISTYGAGGFCEWLGIISPFLDETSNLIEENRFLRKAFVELDGTFYEHPFFPAAGGLLKVGGDENGNFLFWGTSGSPDEWHVAYGSNDGLEFERFELTLTEFLTEWLSDRLHPLCDDVFHVVRSRGVFFTPDTH